MIIEFDLDGNNDVFYNDTGKDIIIIGSWIDPLKKKVYIEYVKRI